MSLTRNVRMLARYSAWANARLFEFLSGFEAAAQAEPQATQWRGLLATLNHAQHIDGAWQAHLQGKPHGFSSRTPEVPLPFDALKRAQHSMDQWYIDYADALTDAAHDEVISFQFIGGDQSTMSRGDILLHIVNHKTFHRGYVAQRIYFAESRPPTRDLPVFLRDAWPLLSDAANR